MDIDIKDLIEEDNIVELLQSKIDLLNKKYWNDDICPPDFIVSLLYDNNLRDKKMEQYIILTCQHLSSSVSSVIYPIDKNFYGYESILRAMNDLYNQTM